MTVPWYSDLKRKAPSGFPHFLVNNFLWLFYDAYSHLWATKWEFAQFKSEWSLMNNFDQFVNWFNWLIQKYWLKRVDLLTILHKSNILERPEIIIFNKKDSSNFCMNHSQQDIYITCIYKIYRVNIHIMPTFKISFPWLFRPRKQNFSLSDI